MPASIHRRARRRAGPATDAEGVQRLAAARARSDQQPALRALQQPLPLGQRGRRHAHRVAIEREQRVGPVAGAREVVELRRPERRPGRLCPRGILHEPTVTRAGADCQRWRGAPGTVRRSGPGARTAPMRAAMRPRQICPAGGPLVRRALAAFPDRMFGNAGWHRGAVTTNGIAD